MDTSSIDAVLAVRADRLARRHPKQSNLEEKTMITVITVGNERFGIPTRYLTCIVKSPSIADMPGLPAWMRGTGQIRGELVSIVDIAIWFGLKKKSGGHYIAVVESDNRRIGVLLDAVGGFREIGKADIAETFNITMGNHPIYATTKDIVTVLDIPRLFENKDMIVEFLGVPVHTN